MPATAQKTPLAYLREARLAAGYVSRGTAAAIVPYSPETIGRHERGEVPVEPTDAVMYARCYENPGIMYRYCADCPVGRQIGRTATERSFPFATLRIRRLIADGQAVASRLEEIAFDGVIDESEREDFSNALDYLRALERGITEIMLIGLENGKGRPGTNGNGPSGNN